MTAPVPHAATGVLGVAATERAVRTGQARLPELVEASLRAIDDANGALRAFVRVDHDDAVEQARQVERRLEQGASLPLAGVTLGVKDNIDLAGHETRSGSRVLAGRVPAEDATVIARLRAAGAVIVGSTTMHEFALGGTSENPHDGDVRNPLDPAASPGGSSGGSAAAVAAGLVAAALGTDTCGSIRMPAALTGTVGLRPTTGTVPLHGVLPLAPTMDTVGPMTRSTLDNALLWQTIAGRSADSSVVPAIRRVLVARLSDVAPAVEQAVQAVAAILGERLATVELDDDGWIRDSVDVASTTFLREAADLHETWLREHADLYGEDVRAGIRAGSAITAEEYLDAARRRFELTVRARQAIGPSDVLLLPVFGFGWIRSHVTAVETAPGVVVERDAAMLRYISAAAVTGLPALSVRGGQDEHGHPIGVQLVGAPGAEPRLYELARILEESGA
ncbi:hypothetical protein BAY59_27215 [Prauserella coralliicola]|nr:hypothetical protein BAY59_27215 [Prauserella coralliicola]